jgi:transposase
MTSYSRDPNSVEEVSFELLKPMAETFPLLQQLGEDFLRRLVEGQPDATLHQYCQIIRRERGLSLSQQTMCKLLARIGMTGRVRRQLVTTPSEALAA